MKKLNFVRDTYQEEIIDGHIHVIPTSGKRHLENKNCWCCPILDYKDEITNIEVWVHKGYDELEQ